MDVLSFGLETRDSPSRLVITLHVVKAPGKLFISGSMVVLTTSDFKQVCTYSMSVENGGRELVKGVDPFFLPLPHFYH